MDTHEQQHAGNLLTLDMAHQNPEEFKHVAIEHMGTTTELGALAWNHALDTGTLKLDQFTIDPRTWASFSRANGYLSLGVAPMSQQEKAQYLYLGEHMSYADEVSRRLLHEVTHNGIFLAQRQPMMSVLLQTAHTLRQSDSAGLTTLGSHPHYKTPFDRAVEDIVELVTMREVGADHLAGYLEILSADKYEPLRSRLDLLRFEDTDTLRALIDGATKEALTTNP